MGKPTSAALDTGATQGDHADSRVAAMDVGELLRSVGLERYEKAFRDNEIDAEDLSELTEADFDRLGIPLGPRRRLLKAIRALGTTDAVVDEVRPTTAPQTPPEPRDTAERRQLTVMFCDLVGSTGLSSRMDPEDLREVITTYQAASAKVIQTYDGLLAKLMGDGILAYFGYPRAHEDDAERAVRAGLDIIRAVSALKTRSPAPLQVRIGIATGLVVVGDLIGSGEAQERGVVGETPNLAARLQGLAEPNSIVIGPTTRRVLGDLFEYQDLGPIEIKGFDAPVQAYQVLRPSSVESRFEALRTTTTPLVGRDEEIDLLMRRWERAKEGDGSVVLIAGEPGIGKSRIAQAVQDRLGGEPHTRLGYFCSPHHQDSALFPFIAQLERAAGFRRDDSNEQRLTKLETTLAQATNALGEAVPFLANLLSIPTGEQYPPLNLTPQKRKEKTLKALLAQVEGLALQQPVLMIFEDAHWLDPTTREWLDLIIDQVSALRVLLIVTFRPEFPPPWLGRPQVTFLTLNRLPPRQRAQIISGVMGGKALPKEIIDQIIERTDGIPLFVEEMTKAVVESGVLTDAGDRYTLAGPLTLLAIPTSLHASLLARLDRLAPVREVAQIAAALGRQFSHELISAVSPMPKQQLDDALEQLVTAELIFRRGTPPDAEYTFKHALVQDAAYSTLLKSGRQQIHARIATTLEEKFPEIVTAEPALLAHHCAEAKLIEKAVGYFLKAGQQSVTRSAMTEAVTQLQKGLDLVAALPEGLRRKELDLQIALGSAFMAAKGLASVEMGRAYHRAYELCQQTGEISQRILALWGLWQFHLNRAEFADALDAAEALLRCASDQGDATAELIGHRTVAVSRFFRGELEAAGGQFDQALALYSPASGPIDARINVPLAVGTGGTVLIPPGVLPWTMLLRGYPNQALARSREVVGSARKLNHLYTLAQILHQNCVLEQLIGNSDAVERKSAELIVLSTEQGFAHWLATGMIFRGWCMTLKGEAQTGAAEMRRGLVAKKATGAELKVPYYLGLMASVAGGGDETNTLLIEALRRVENTGERWFEAELHRLQGDLLRGRDSEAAFSENSFRRALIVASEQRAKFWELRAATSLARLWHDQGKRAEARDLLVPVYNWFTEGFDTPVLKEAKALLATLQ